MAAALAVGMAGGGVGPDRLIASRPGRAFPPGPPGPIRAALARGGFGAEAETLWAAWLGLVMAAAGSGVLAGLGPLPTLAALLGPPAWIQLRKSELEQRRRALVAPALEAMAASLRSGRSLAQAVADARSVGPPLDEELGAIVARHGAGQPLRQAVSTWSAARTAPEDRLAGAALAVAATAGGGSARALDGAAYSIRTGRDVAAERAALATQARTSAAVMSLAPLAFAVATAAGDARIGRFLFGTPTGWLVLVSGVGLDLLGIVWMQRLVRAAT